MIRVALAQTQLGPTLAKVDSALHLQAEQPDPVPKTKHIISISSNGPDGNSGARGCIRRLTLQQSNHLLKLRFAMLQNFGARIEKGSGNLLQLGLAGLAALFECHVQSVLSNL